MCVGVECTRRRGEGGTEGGKGRGLGQERGVTTSAQSFPSSSQMAQNSTSCFLFGVFIFCFFFFIRFQTRSAVMTADVHACRLVPVMDSLELWRGCREPCLCLQGLSSSCSWAISVPLVPPQPHFSSAHGSSCVVLLSGRWFLQL